MDTEAFNHAIALRDAGKVEEAIEQLTLLARSTPDPQEKASLLLNEATCLAILGRYEEARERDREAVRISPTPEIRASADFDEAAFYLDHDQCGKALRLFDRLMKRYKAVLALPGLHDLNERIQVFRGLALVSLSRFREARTVLEECLRFDLTADDERAVLSRLGTCYKNVGDNDRAKRALLEALDKGVHGPEAVYAHYHLGTIYFAEKAYAKALMELEWCLAHVEEGKIPKKHICEWLRSTTSRLGMKEEAQRYDKLANC